MSRLLVRATALISISALTLGPAFAQAPAPAAVAPAAPGAPAPAGPPLTLEECIALAMKKNFDLQIQGFSTELARENVIVAHSNTYLPTFSGSTSRQISRGAPRLSEQDDGTFRLVSNNSNATNFTGRVSQPIPLTNGSVSVSGNVQRTSNSAASPFSGGTSVAINQPLLRNAGKTVATAALERAKISLSVAFINYRSRVLTVIRDVENAYYNLVAARETLRIRQLTQAYNQQLFDENRTRRTTGVATDLDVFTAEYGLATARRAAIQAEQSVSEREDALLVLINTPNFDVRPGPVAFEAYKPAPVSFATSYKLTRDNYPDTLSAEQTIKQLEIDVATAKRNQLPTLDLSASVGYTNTNNVSYGEIFTGLPDVHGETRNLGFTYSVPWGMRASRSQYRSRLLDLNSQKLQLERLELQLLVQVRTAVRSVEANVLAVEIAAKATELASRQYDLQKARFDAGLSTSRLVLQAQDDLETARFNELSANVTLRGAYAELQRLEGTSIARFGVQLPE